MSDLSYHSAQVAPREEAQARVRPAERVRRDPGGQQHPTLGGALLVHPLHDPVVGFLVPRAGMPFNSRLRTFDGFRRPPVRVGKIGSAAPWVSCRRAGTAARCARSSSSRNADSSNVRSMPAAVFLPSASAVTAHPVAGEGNRAAETQRQCTTGCARRADPTDASGQRGGDGTARLCDERFAKGSRDSPRARRSE